MTQNTFNKASHLWNVQQPGDPYDIKKSMIARLPEHPTKPMGEYLEMVCLLQAAEIQRLSDYLTELQYKYREVERRQLDRHSYEVQIKELAEKNLAYGTLKSENQRLKDYIRRQALELQQQQKRNIHSMSLEAFQAKYEGVLNQLKMAREHNERAQKQIAKLNYENSEWRVKWQRSQQQKAALKSQFQRQIREKVDIEVRVAMERSQERISRLQIEIRQLREFIDSKNQQIQLLNSQKEQLFREMKSLQEKNRSRSSIEEAVNEKNKEIHRLNLVITEKTTRLEQATSALHKTGEELRRLEEKYLLLERQNENLLARIREVEQLSIKAEDLDRYQERVAMMSMEIQRLSGLNNHRTRELNEANRQIECLRADLKKAIANHERNQAELQTMAAHQSRIRALTQELDRITFQLKSKNDEIVNLQQKIVITESTSTQLAHMAAQKSKLQQQLQASRTEFRNYRTITDSELNTLRIEVNKLKYELQQSTTSKGQAEKYKIQSERMRAQLQRIKNEALSFRRTLDEEKNNLLRISTERNKIAEERNRLIEENRHIGSELIQLRNDIAQLRQFTRESQQKDATIRKLRAQLQTIESRHSQLQGTVENIYKQIERLHSVLSTKTNELMRITREYSQLEEKCRFLENKLGNSGSEKQYYEKEISKYKNQIETLKIQFQHRNNQFVQERQKYQRISQQKDRLIAQHIKEKDNLERKLVELQRDMSKKGPYQAEIQKNKEELRQKESIIIRLQTVIREKQALEKQSEGKIRHWQSRIVEWESRLKDAERAMMLKDQDKDRLNQEIIHLNEIITNLKFQNDERAQQRLAIVTDENIRLKKTIEENQKGRYNEESLRLQLHRAEETIKLQRSEKQDQRLQIRHLQEVINRQNKQLQSLRQSTKEYQMKIVHIENTNTKVLQDRIREFQLKLQDRDNLIISLQKEIKTLEGQFGSYVDRDRNALSSLTQYQRKIQILSAQFDRLNQLLEDKTRQIWERDRIIDSLKLQLNQKSSSHSEEQYRIQIANYKMALSELQNINTHVIAERDELFKVSHQMKAEYQQTISKITLDLKYRVDECRKLSQELAAIRNKEQSYLIRIKELQVLGSRRAEDSSLRSKLGQLEQQLAASSRQVNEFKIENTNLRTQRNQLELMVQELKSRGEISNQHEISQLAAQIEEYATQLKALQEENALWENKYNSLYSAYAQLYNNYNLTKNEYEITIANIRVYQSKLFKLQQDFQALSDALRSAKLEIEQLKKQNYSLKIRHQEEGDLYQKNLLLSKEIDRLNQISQKMKIEISDTRIRLTDNVSLNKRIEEHLGLFVILFAEIESLRNRLANSEKECEDVRRSSIAPLRVDKSMGPRP